MRTIDHIAGKARLRHFTFIEMMSALIAAVVILAMGVPSFIEIRQKAKFIRWQAYNAHWNRDADCVVNFNFQEGSGNILRNGAEACDWSNRFGQSYNARDYDGRLSTAFNDKTSNFTWYYGGRWSKYKKALRFKYGLNNCVQIGNARLANQKVGVDAVLDYNTGEVSAMACTNNKNMLKTKDLYKVDPQRDALDFTPLDSFTVIAWIKFGDENGSLSALSNYQCIFARCFWGTSGVTNPESSGFSTAQYDLYTDIKSGASGKKGAFDVDAFTLCPGFDESAVDFKDYKWKQVALRYSNPPRAALPGESNTSKVYRAIDVFYNGKMQAGKRMTNNSQALGSRAPGELILGGARTSYNAATGGASGLASGAFSFPFEGLMDEFMVFKRPLSDGEILGEYNMGTDHRYTYTNLEVSGTSSTPAK